MTICGDRQMFGIDRCITFADCAEFVGIRRRCFAHLPSACRAAAGKLRRPLRAGGGCEIDFMAPKWRAASNPGSAMF
jgi:hypothetical protein